MSHLNHLFALRKAWLHHAAPHLRRRGPAVKQRGHYVVSDMLGVKMLNMYAEAGIDLM